MKRLVVDLGATWLRIEFHNAAGKSWKSRVAAVPWRQSPTAIRVLLRKRGIGRVDDLLFGGTRLGSAQDRKELSRRLAPLCRHIRVLTDYELAHQGVFKSSAGVILVASTGSIAFARDTTGKTRRAGGLGPLLGDEGSGFWIGKQALLDSKLRATLRLPNPLSLARDCDPVRAIAALAPRVMASTNPRARALTIKAAAALASIAQEAVRSLKFSRPIPLALHGSLFKNTEIREAVLRRLPKFRAAPTLLG